MASQGRIHTLRLLILSDTHGQDFFDDLDHEPYWNRADMPKADVVLHCGDLTNRGSIPDNAAAISMLSAFDAELKLVIAGNHDVSLDAQMCKGAEKQQLHRKVTEMWTGPRAKDAGIRYLTEGFHTFTLSNGATFTVYASPFTPEFNNWAFGYPRGEDRFESLRSSDRKCGGGSNPAPDIVMTHGPPQGFLDCVRGESLGCRHLLSAVKTAKSRLHCFGHVHEGAGAVSVDWETMSAKKILASAPSLDKPLVASAIDGRGLPTVSTVMVNAAMVDSRNKLQYSSPWIVDMDVTST